LKSLPITCKVAVPEHKPVGPEMAGVGAGTLAPTVLEALAVQPFASVTVTVYVPEIPTCAVKFVWLLDQAQLSKLPGDDKVAMPEQSVDGPDMVGSGCLKT
jgi:hypothetical protein